ncbi:COG3014 family protein [Sideroxydans sp.]
MRSIADPSATTRFVPHALACALWLTLSGCASTGIDNELVQPGRLEQLLEPKAEVPAALRPFVLRDQEQGRRDRVLNEAMAGLSALELSQPEIAQRLLSDAQALIETIYAHDPAANRARSNFVPEANKDFKGDPYERAMVGYYLALADFSDPDLDNARADLRFAEIQDTMSASETFQSDMVIMPFIRGWLYNCSGRSAQAKDEFAAVRKAKPGIKTPAATDNVLLIAEVGRAPGKVASGRHQEELRYARRDDGTIRGVTYTQDAQLLVGQQIEDVYWQASTRGGRAVDKILAGKASFRNTAEGIATGAAVFAHISSDLARNAARRRDSDDANQYAGLALLGILVSIGSDIVAASTHPEADTRTWSSLPDRIYVATTQADMNAEQLPWSLGFHDAKGALQSAVEMKSFRSGACMLVWGRQYPGSYPSSWTDSSLRHEAAVHERCKGDCSAIAEQATLDAKNFNTSLAPLAAPDVVPDNVDTGVTFKRRIFLTNPN